MAATRLRIALADDEPDLRLAMASLLRRLGHSVVCSVGNGQELLDACSRDSVDLALVDLDMPVMDGLTAAEHLGEKGVPVVLISGHPDVEYVVVESEPIAARLLKPATIESLQQALQQAVEQQDG
jgi:two-component system, response regulator PdtaR